jgi:hypothetical protein
MYTLNIYTRQRQYLHSISQNTRKACLKIAEQKYSELCWDWDDKNYVKNKKFLGNPSTAVSISLDSLI